MEIMGRWSERAKAKNSAGKDTKQHRALKLLLGYLKLFWRQISEAQRAVSQDEIRRKKKKGKVGDKEQNLVLEK